MKAEIKLVRGKSFQTPFRKFTSGGTFLSINEDEINYCKRDSSFCVKEINEKSKKDKIPDACSIKKIIEDEPKEKINLAELDEKDIKKNIDKLTVTELKEFLIENSKHTEESLKGKTKPYLKSQVILEAKKD